MKTIFNIMIGITILISMIYVAAVDSMSTSDIILYLVPVAFLWYVVKLMNDEIKKESEKN